MDKGGKIKKKDITSEARTMVIIPHTGPFVAVRAAHTPDHLAYNKGLVRIKGRHFPPVVSDDPPGAHCDSQPITVQPQFNDFSV